MDKKLLKEISARFGSDNSIFKTLYDESPVGLCLCAANGDVFFMNRSAFDILKLDKRYDQNNASNHFNLIECIAEYSTIFKQNLKKNKFLENNFEIRTNDQARIINNKSKIINFDNSDFVFINIFDITDNMKTENDMKNMEHRINSFFDSLEEGYYEIDLKGNFTYMNKSFCDISGFEYSELIDKKYKVLFDNGEEKIIRKIFTDVYEHEVFGKYLDWLKIKNYNKKRLIEGTVSLIKDIDGNKIGFRGIIRDVTSRYNLEQDFLRTRKLEAVGILAGGIAHDYNNALTAILGNLSLAKMELDPQNKELMELLTDAESASIKIMDLTEILSSFSKTGKPKKVVVDSKKFIKDTAQEIFSENKVKHKIKINDNLKKIEIDQMQIRNVFKHIIENAIEAMPDGGIVIIEAKNLKVEKEETHHKITLQQGDYVIISFTDEGVGISEENFHKIFVPYFTTKDYVSGMGLAISYAVIKRHSGYIDVKSEEGKGSTFSIYLPISSSEINNI